MTGERPGEAGPVGGASASDGAGSDTLGTWAAIGGLFVLSAAAGAYEIAPASVTPVIMADLGVSEPAASGLISVMYATAVVASIPVGAALDRFVVRRAVTAAALALLGAGAWGWAAAGAGAYWALVASRVLGGLSYVTIWNAGADLASRSVPADRRATAVGVFTASAPAGFALGQLGAPVVEAGAGWPAIFPAFAAVAVLGLVLYRLGTRRLRQTGGGPTESDTPTLSEFRRVLVNRNLWTVCGMGFIAFVLYLFLNSWLPTFLVQRFDAMTLAKAGLLAALFPGVGIVARTAGGAISDRVFGGRRRPVAFLSFAVSAPLVLGIAVFGQVAVVVALLTAAGATIQLGIGLLFSYVREVVPETVGATAVSVLTSVGLLGAFVAPIAAGAIIQRTGGFWTAFAAASAVAVLGAGLALVAPEPG